MSSNKRFKAGTGFGSRSNPIVITSGPPRDRKVPRKAQAQSGGRSAQLNRQLKALISAKKRDSALVATSGQATTTTIDCATSTTWKATAASGTGLLDVDADEVMINSLHIRNVLSNPATLDVDITLNQDALVRKIVVWFYKPLLVASAAGTLPPVTEVLESDNVNSMVVTAASNGGRFKILWDKTFNLGTNTYGDAASTLGTHHSGVTTRVIDKWIKVNKMCKFKASGSSGTGSGHYDSDVSAGQVDRGLLIIYTLTTLGGAGYISESGTRRINYTG